MSALPFSVSADAAAWISEKLLSARGEPELASLIPGLYYILDEQYRSEEGQVLEWCPFPFFDVAWERPETGSLDAYVEAEIGGWKILIPPTTLEKLKGKQLILETVDVGFPKPADKKRKMLKAAPLAPEQLS